MHPSLWSQWLHPFGFRSVGILDFRLPFLQVKISPSCITLLGTKISPPQRYFCVDYFPFPKVDMLVFLESSQYMTPPPNNFHDISRQISPHDQQHVSITLICSSSRWVALKLSHLVKG